MLLARFQIQEVEELRAGALTLTTEARKTEQMDFDLTLKSLGCTQVQRREDRYLWERRARQSGQRAK